MNGKPMIVPPKSEDLPQGGLELQCKLRISVIKYYNGYPKTMHHMAKKQVCHGEYSELPLTHKTRIKLDSFG